MPLIIKDEVIKTSYASHQQVAINMFWLSFCRLCHTDSPILTCLWLTYISYIFNNTAHVKRLNWEINMCRSVAILVDHFYFFIIIQLWCNFLLWAMTPQHCFFWSAHCCACVWVWCRALNIVNMTGIAFTLMFTALNHLAWAMPGLGFT